MSPVAEYSRRHALALIRWRVGQVRITDGKTLTQEEAAKALGVQGGARVWRRWEAPESAKTKAPVPGWLRMVVREGRVLTGYIRKPEE